MISMKPSVYLAQEENVSATAQQGMLDQEKAVVEEFILCYKHNRVLWDSKCGRNVSRTEKDEIFNTLAGILGKIKSNCTVDDVKKKINALRSNYRRELRKVRRSQAVAGENKDAIFQPTLWWYELMGFLEDVERPFDDVFLPYTKLSKSLDHVKMESSIKKRRSSSSHKNLTLPLPTYDDSGLQSYNSIQVNPNIAEQTQPMHIFKEEREETNNTPSAAECLQEMHVGDTEDKCAINGSESSNGYQSITNSNMPRNFQTPHSTNSYMEDNFYYKLPERAKTGDCDTYFYLAHLWANKLRHVESRQRLYAEKAINDIIFEAELGTLTRNSVKINET